MSDRYFPRTYAESRHRFLNAARAVAAKLYSYEVDSTVPEDLTIDVAILGAEDAPALIVSSGVHGVEGFCGAAVQLALLERLNDPSFRKDIRYILIHGLNPYGFSHLRRFNEDNVDLNRNFLKDPADYAGVPDGYNRLNGLLNPQSPPSQFEPFKLKALGHIWLTGLQTLKQVVAGGQYEYPRGLFFGGKGPCRSTQIVQDNCAAWLAAAEQILHIDFHAGLGSFAATKLLVSETKDSEHYAWYVDTFGAEYVESHAQPGGIAYSPSGSFGEWLQNYFSARDYRFMCAEFGTYDIIRILGAVRAENRAQHYGTKNSQPYLRAKHELQECFCPASLPWRRQVVTSGLRIITQGQQALSVLAEDH